MSSDLVDEIWQSAGDKDVWGSAGAQCNFACGKYCQSRQGRQRDAFSRVGTTQIGGELIGRNWCEDNARCRADILIRGRMRANHLFPALDDLIDVGAVVG